MVDTTKKKSSHILPLWIYFSVAGVLIVLTCVTVVVAQFDLGEWNVVVAILVAAVKATLVLLFFMHLLYDNKLYALVFGSSVLFLALFIILTMSDTQNRAAVYFEKATSIHEEAGIYSTSTRNEPEDTGTDHALAAWEELRKNEDYIFGDAKATYAKYCTVCHGDQGKGDGFNAFNLDPKPMSFSDSTVVGRLSNAYLYRVITEGSGSVGLSSSCPPHKRNLTEEEIRRVALFVQALSTVD